VYVWSIEKFNDKLLMMRDVVSQYDRLGKFPTLKLEDNPFEDDVQPILIGQGYYKLEALAYQIDNPAQCSIISTTCNVYGKMNVNIIPCNPFGDDIPEEDLVDDPQDLIG
jgi:hypothetical protein